MSSPELGKENRIKRKGKDEKKKKERTPLSKTKHRGTKTIA